MITADEACDKSKQTLLLQKQNTANWIQELLPSVEAAVFAACSSGKFETSMSITIRFSEETESAFLQADQLRAACAKFGYEVKLDSMSNRSNKGNRDYVLLLKWHPKE